MDMQLPIFMFTFLENSFYLLSVLTVACLSSYAVIGLTIPVVIFFLWLREFFAKSVRELKRIEGVTRTPLYNIFQETSMGLSHIRAFGMLDQFYARYSSIADANFKVFFHQQASTPWLAQRLNLLASVLILGIVLSGIFMPRRDGHASLIGFALSTALGLMGRLIQTTMASIETENHMTAVERLQHFDTIPQEPLDIEDGPTAIGKYEQSTKGGDKSWPSAGQVKFQDVYLCYRPGLPDVLKGLSFTVHAGERIGIIGRTGSGKSSTMLALLRLVETRSGTISIDDVDISEVPLQQLRGTAVSIIPQDPYLFEGSVRENLDPFSTHADTTLWEALGKVSITDVITSLGGLEASIVEGAENLSAGQRQLMCIARTMLRHSKVIMLDEATASIDTATDQLVQSSLRTCFQGCTSLAIAHRLETIIESDRIICLSGGNLKEVGSPCDLLADPQSELSHLAAAAGLTSPSVLRTADVKIELTSSRMIAGKPRCSAFLGCLQ